MHTIFRRIIHGNRQNKRMKNMMAPENLFVICDLAANTTQSDTHKAYQGYKISRAFVIYC